jgi:hypothetical protein
MTHPTRNEAEHRHEIDRVRDATLARDRFAETILHAQISADAGFLVHATKVHLEELAGRVYALANEMIVARRTRSVGQNHHFVKEAKR